MEYYINFVLEMFCFTGVRICQYSQNFKKKITDIDVCPCIDRRQFQPFFPSC